MQDCYPIYIIYIHFDDLEKAIISDKSKKLDIFNKLSNFLCGGNSLTVPCGPFESNKIEGQFLLGLRLNITFNPNQRTMWIGLRVDILTHKGKVCQCKIWTKLLSGKKFLKLIQVGKGNFPSWFGVLLI